MPYLHNASPTLRERLLRLFRKREEEIRAGDFHQLPVVVINDRKTDAQRIIVRSATTNGATIFTTSSEARRQFYIDGFNISGAHATDSAVVNSITATIGGTAQVIASIHLTGLSLTGGVSHPSHALAFAVPLPIDAGTNITFQLGSDAGRGIIYGHYEDF